MNRARFNILIKSLPLTKEYRKLCLAIGRSQSFFDAPASTGTHHKYTGGLVKHTFEVVELCATSGEADMNVLLTAAVWHDYAKVFEYRFDGIVWTKTTYAKEIGHIVGSVLELKKMIAELGLKHINEDAVVHCMLAHHGRKEWGSPVEPNTKEAFFLHNADMISARGLC